MTDTQHRPRLDPEISVDDFVIAATEWYEANAAPKQSVGSGRAWGEGAFDVSVFADMSFEDERDHILGIAGWIRRKASQGYHAVDWPVEYGGLGLSRAHARALGRVERQYETPGTHELVSVTVGLIASTIQALVDQGRLGMKTKGGIFDYTDEQIAELRAQRFGSLVKVRKALNS